MRLIKTEVCNQLPDWATDYKPMNMHRWYAGVYTTWFPRFILRIEYAVN